MTRKNITYLVEHTLAQSELESEQLGSINFSGVQFTHCLVLWLHFWNCLVEQPLAAQCACVLQPGSPIWHGSHFFSLKLHFCIVAVWFLQSPSFSHWSWEGHCPLPLSSSLHVGPPGAFQSQV